MNGPSPAEAVRDVTSDGVDRTIEVSLSENIDLDAAVVSEGAVIAAYASQVARLNASFWPLLFTNVTLRMMGSDDLPSAAQQLASKVSPTRPPRTPLTSLSQKAIARRRR